MWTNSNCKTQNSSNQVTTSCAPSCNFRIKCIALEQWMKDVNLKLQHSGSFSIDTKVVFPFRRVILGSRWLPDGPTTKIPIGTHIKISLRKRINNLK